MDDAWIMKMSETLLFKFLLFKKLIHINSSLRCPLPVVEPFSLDAMFNLALLCLDHGGLWQLLQTSSFVFFCLIHWKCYLYMILILSQSLSWCTYHVSNTHKTKIENIWGKNRSAKALDTFKTRMFKSVTSH